MPKEATNEAKASPRTNYPYDVHTMVRTLGTDAAPAVGMVDAHLQEWIDSGYKLVGTHYAGDAKDQGARMIYILYRERA